MRFLKYVLLLMLFSVPADAGVTPGAGGSPSVFPDSVTVTGVISGSDAATGVVGEYLQANRLRSAASSLTTATDLSVTSLTLTAGDWDVTASCGFTNSGATMTESQCGLSQTDNTQPADDTLAVVTPVADTLAEEFKMETAFDGTATSVDVVMTVSRYRVSLSISDTLFLVNTAVFGAGTSSGYGQIRARRIR